LLGTVLIGVVGAGDKAGSISAIYAATAVLSLAAAVSYWFLIRKKDAWFILLFSSVLVVNAGYLALALSKTLDTALWANRLSYLGSVFLPMSMLMSILKTCRLKYPGYLPGALCGIGAAVFLIAASPGILDIYYKEVSISTINGVTVLEKVYGPWHCIYLLYLLAYVLATAAVIAHACSCKSIDSAIHAVFMSGAIFVNVGVWLVEQLVRIDFELLSVSYIVSEMFLLLLCLMMQNSNAADEPAPTLAPAENTALAETQEESQLPEQTAAKAIEEQCAHFAAQRAALTPTERAIYHFYLEGKSTKEIMAELSIKENTLKYHNKNIYSKLGVSSRKQLMQIASLLPEDH
jgi:DNA-binding CsgD family transcriptional regulator